MGKNAIIQSSSDVDSQRHDTTLTFTEPSKRTLASLSYQSPSRIDAEPNRLEKLANHELSRKAERQSTTGLQQDSVDKPSLPKLYSHNLNGLSSTDRCMPRKEALASIGKYPEGDGSIVQTNDTENDPHSSTKLPNSWDNKLDTLFSVHAGSVSAEHLPGSREDFACSPSSGSLDDTTFLEKLSPSLDFRKESHHQQRLTTNTLCDLDNAKDHKLCTAADQTHDPITQYTDTIGHHQRMDTEHLSNSLDQKDSRGLVEKSTNCREVNFVDGGTLISSSSSADQAGNQIPTASYGVNLESGLRRAVDDVSKQHLNSVVQADAVVEHDLDYSMENSRKHSTALSERSVCNSSGHDDACPEGRVNISELPIQLNPLQKSGRHTVIKGRLAPEHPFSIAVTNLGYKLISKENEGITGSKENADRKKYFIRDLNAFLRETNSKHHKIPVIGGGELDVYALIREVMLLGGVHNVVRKRAFRIVAQQLGIPKTCTSAASVLKGAYEKLLFHYEQKLALDKQPENPERPVNMKDIVYKERERERKTRGLQTRRKRKSWSAPGQLLVQKKGRSIICGNAATSPQVATTGMDPLRESANQQLTMLESNKQEHKIDMPNDRFRDRCERHTQAFAHCGHRSESTGDREMITLAVRECFSSPEGDATYSLEEGSEDEFLIRNTLCSPTMTTAARKNQGFLLNVLMEACEEPGRAIIADNRSAEGLIDSLLSILRSFQKRILVESANTFRWGDLDQLPFHDTLSSNVRQEVAASYCSMRILAEMSVEQQNCSKLFLQNDLLGIITSYLAHPQLHHSFLTASLECLSHAVSHLLEVDSFVIPEVTIKDLISHLQMSASVTSRHSQALSPPLLGVDYGLMELILKIVASLSSAWKVGNETVQTLMDVMAVLLHSQGCLHKGTSETIAIAACNVALASPETTTLHKPFVSGIMHLLHNGKCVDLVTECLQRLYGLQTEMVIGEDHLKQRGIVETFTRHSRDTPEGEPRDKASQFKNTGVHMHDDLFSLEDASFFSGPPNQISENDELPGLQDGSVLDSIFEGL